MSIRAARNRIGSVANRANPRPYRLSELRARREAVAFRWQQLPGDESLFWLRRYSTGRSPYSRVRSHVIRTQLDAVIVLALQLGLRRHEIRGLDVDAVHYDNAHVMVGKWQTPRFRTVPFTASARDSLQAWIVTRHFLGPQTRALWLNTYTCGPRLNSDPSAPGATGTLFNRR
jgi:hypothetical protein